MNHAGGSESHVALRRSLTFGPLLFYGLGLIVGAGIYVAVASVVASAGEAAPLAFLLAGVAAGLTGLCYAELASRFPEAAGAVAYVKHGFGSDRLAQVTGVVLTLAVAIAAASIASGAIQYLAPLLRLPGPVMTTLLVVTFTLVAMVGVRSSAGFSAALGAVEIAGLLVATGAGFMSAPDFRLDGLLPGTVSEWQGVIAGAFVAFFAFIGFESLANMSEEAKDPRHTVPRSIVAAILISTILYVAVTSAVVLADRGGESPLIDLFKDKSASIFAAIGALAISNGVLAEIMMLARLFYGMANHGQLPQILSRVHPRTRTPLLATGLAGGIVLLTAMVVPFERLLAMANALTLGIFVLVDVALFRIKRRTPAHAGSFVIPGWIPAAGAILSAALLVGGLIL